MVNPSAGAPTFVKSAGRTLDLLELVAQSGGGLTFGEITTRLGLPKSSAHNLLATLEQRGWLRLEGTTRRYEIGLRAWLAGQSFLDRLDLPRIAQPHLDAIVTALDETVQLGILEDMTVIYVAKVEGTQPLRLVSHVGARLPAYATGLGKILLAGLDDEELERRIAATDLVAFTPGTIATKSKLLSAVHEVRVHGWAEDRGEYTDGVVCVAVPVREHQGGVAAGLSCTVPRARIDASESVLTNVRGVLLDRAKMISAELGWVGELAW